MKKYIHHDCCNLQTKLIVGVMDVQKYVIIDILKALKNALQKSHDLEKITANLFLAILGVTFKQAIQNKVSNDLLKATVSLIPPHYTYSLG